MLCTCDATSNERIVETLFSIFFEINTGIPQAINATHAANKDSDGEIYEINNKNIKLIIPPLAKFKKGKTRV